MYSLISSLNSSGIKYSNMAWRKSNRENDIQYRETIIKYRELEETRRSVDEKYEQLKIIAQMSTVIGGFTISSICEISIPKGVHGAMLILFGFTSSLVVYLIFNINVI
jgi:hypothetical protein